MKQIFLPLALAVSVAMSSAAPAAEDDMSPRVRVVGEGEIAVSPDMAILTLTVMREAETAREALSANNDAMEAVIASMKAADIEDRDLQTAGFNISPRYVYPQRANEPQEPKIQAYQVTNTLSVRIRALEKLGEILDRSVSLGVNQGGSIAFTNDDSSAALAEARKRAVADAVEKARTLSEAAGVNLGPIIEIVEQSFVPPPIPMGAQAMRAEASDASVPVESGENTYRVHVEMSFGLTQ
jgi:uncharacterized protein YggE